MVLSGKDNALVMDLTNFRLRENNSIALLKTMLTTTNILKKIQIWLKEAVTFSIVCGPHHNECVLDERYKN